MLVTVFASCLMLASALLLVTSLRSVVTDTIRSARLVAHGLLRRGGLGPRLAFCALWLLIFAVSYG